ncbi:alpha/beta fold hydrolase [Paenibacillus wulumuqiensis]|uniref:alpha/beta fold hydrolase n=1 Tax=Paenibacillus wulumuqiensis TaxID=1567107 RepID=UPI000696C1AA|nr:alpha/beta hydrolase [Paenibacillus wulumuqiensis]
MMAMINGIPLWYTDEGTGLPIVLLHGGPGAYDYMEPVSALLDQRLLRVIRYDQRGSWRSGKTGPYDLETFIEDLEQLRIHLGMERWMICGHSWGASLGLAYTAHYPHRVDALIYLSGTGIDPAWHEQYRINRLAAMNSVDREEYIHLRSILGTLTGELWQHTSDRIRELSVRTDLVRQEQYDQLPRVDGQYLNNEVNRQLIDSVSAYFATDSFRQALAGMAVRVLCIHGENDPRPVSVVRQLSDKLPQGVLISIEDCGHYPWLDQPEELGRRLQHFLMYGTME